MTPSRGNLARDITWRLKNRRSMRRGRRWKNYWRRGKLRRLVWVILVSRSACSFFFCREGWVGGFFCSFSDLFSKSFMLVCQSCWRPRRSSLLWMRLSELTGTHPLWLYLLTTHNRMHPHQTQRELLPFCKERGIVLTAYSPTGTPNVHPMRLSYL